MLGKLWNLWPSETLRGYENPELIETIFRKSVAYRPTAPWPEMVGVSSVLDFGGGAGLHYKQADNPSTRWAIVETPAMVTRAKELETCRLKFFTDINDAAAWLGHIDVMHSNGAIQYTPDPLSIVHRLCDLRADRMLWSRLLFGGGTTTQLSRLQDNGPGHMATARKKVACDATCISQNDFIAVHQGYRIEARGDDWFRFVR